MSEVAMWEVGAGSIFALMIVAMLCKELANNRHLGQPMGPTRKVVTFVAALAALYGILHTLQPRETAVAPVAATDAVATAVAPVESTPIAAPAPPPPVVAAVPEAKAPSISNSSATSSVKGRRDDRRHRRRERVAVREHAKQ